MELPKALGITGPRTRLGLEPEHWWDRILATSALGWWHDILMESQETEGSESRSIPLNDIVLLLYY